MIYNLDRRTLGLNFTGDSSEFRTWAPKASKVELVVNNKNFYEAERGEFGYWNLTADGIRPGDLYQVRIDGGKLLPDPASLLQETDVHGHSLAFDLNDFNWRDDGWTGVQENLIIYELHTGTFTGNGTFDGIAEKLTYLRDLGVNTIEIMPVAQFPGKRNWGYDGVLIYAVQNSYGGPAGLQKLIDLCHLNGIAVILDVVYNHLGPEGNYLNEFGPYFTDNYKTPWGQAVNFDSQWSDGVRHYYTENMLMWLRDFHVDGLRLDAVHAIKDFSAKHILRELRETADRLEAKTGRKYTLIAELDLNDRKYIDPPEKGGFGLDKQWVDEFHHSLHSLVTGERNGYYSDFGDISHLVKSFNDAYVYDGIWSEHRKRTFGSKTKGIDRKKFVVFTQNHDHIGNRMLGERLGRITGFEELKLVAATMFLSPFIPLIFMGEEYNAPNPFMYFTSHTDEVLAVLVSKGRRNEFPEFMKSGEFPEPQSEEMFENSILKFDVAGQNRLMYEFYREMIRLKKQHPVMMNYDSYESQIAEPGTKTMFFSGKTRKNLLYAFMNFENEPQKMKIRGIEKAYKHMLINSAAKKWGGPVPDSAAVADGDYILIQRTSVLIFSDIQ